LLEKEIYILLTANLQYVFNPRSGHGTGTPSALPPDDRPLHSRNIEASEIFKEWFNRQEFEGRRRGTKMSDARQAITLVFNANAPPNVAAMCREIESTAEHVAQSFRSFCEYLVGVPVRFNHNARDVFDVIIRDRWLKEVAHTVHENGA
jgi:hypothetical protein